MKVKLALVDAENWLLSSSLKIVFYLIVWNRQGIVTLLEITQLSLWMTAPDLVPELFIATTMEPKIPTTISWQLGEHLALLETWIPEIWGYYLCPGKLRKI